MKVKHSALVSLFKELDFAAADGWPLARMVKKIEGLPAFVKAEETTPKTADGKALLKKLLAALKAGEEIKITDVPEASAKKEKAAAPAKEEKKPAKKAAAKEETDDEDEEEGDAEESDDEESDEEESDESDDAEEADTETADEDDEEEASDDESDEGESEDEDSEDDDEEEKPAKKDKKKGKKGSFPKKAGAEGKPGVIASIQEFLTAASKEKPISKKKMCEKLQARFPERDGESMMRTINVQIPNRMKKEKKLNIVKGEKGYYISKKPLPADEKVEKTKTKPAKEEADDEDDED